MSSSNSLTYMSNFRLHVRCLTEIGKVLADNGLRIGVEYLGTRTLAGRNKFPFIRTLGGMKDLTDATGLDNVGLTLDAWHWFQAGDTEEDIARLSNRDVVNADICDAPAGMAREEMPDSPRALPCATSPGRRCVAPACRAGPVGQPTTLIRTEPGSALAPRRPAGGRVGGRFTRRQ